MTVKLGTPNYLFTVYHRHRAQYEVNINFRLTGANANQNFILFARFQHFLKTFAMKWETVTSSIGQTVYTLWNNGRKLSTLVFNSSSNAARIEYADEKRVFLIRDEGFRKNKTVLRTEYGIRIGHTGSEKNENFIVLNDERYFYSVDDKKEPAVTIYKESIDRPLAVCGLDIKDDLLAKAGSRKPLQQKTLYSLLIGLCWYLFNPAESEKTLGYTL